MKKIILAITIVVSTLLLFGCGKETLEINNSYAEPDYEYQLYLSDELILGEVIEDCGGKYTNPDGTGSVVNAWETTYKVRVQRAFKGDVNEGDTILVKTWNKTGLPVDAEKNYIITGNDKPEFYLTNGESGVFMLSYDEELLTDKTEKAYFIVYGDEGLFKPKENDETSKLFVSPSFEMNTDKIADDISKAASLYGDSNDKNEI